MQSVFCYGCLHAERLQVLLGRSVATPAPAMLLDHCRIVCGERDHWKDKDGSGGGVFSVWPLKGSVVEGIVAAVSKDELVGVLDAFEHEYERKRVHVWVVGKGWVVAWVYLRKDTRFVVPPSRKYLKEVRQLLRPFAKRLNSV